MPELTSQNIEQISCDISRQEIVYSHLLDELVDHVCCDVENEMLAGIAFPEAYEIVKRKAGPGRFREIQKDTLYAVDFKYRNMKNTMKTSAIAGTIMFGLASLFKIQHWPLAGILMTAGAILLAFVFLPTALGVLWKETHNKNRIFLFVSGFIAGAFLIVGALFKVQHWPLAGIMLSASVLSGVFLFFPALLITIFKDEERRKYRYLALTTITGIIFYNLGILFKIQHWPMATLLIIIGTVTTGFIALPWYTRISWHDSKTIHPEFIFLVVACLVIFVPGMLINLNYQEDKLQQTEAAAPESAKEVLKSLNEVK